MPTEARQGADYRSNLHVPGMDSVPDSEVFEGETLAGDQSFSTFGKEMPHHPNQMHQHQHHQHHLNASTLERKEFDALLCNSRMPYKAACLCEYLKESAFSLSRSGQISNSRLEVLLNSPLYTCAFLHTSSFHLSCDLHLPGFGLHSLK